METKVRKPFQGVTNIIRFNWHFYVIAGGLIISLLVAAVSFNTPYTFILHVIVIFITLTITLSLAVSYYVYDYSPLYRLTWLNDLISHKEPVVVNVNAGFDETSTLLARHFPKAQLHVFDFYDRKKHTEVSIERARKAYEPYPGTVQITTAKIPVGEGSADLLFNIFSLHEVRNQEERIAFLQNQHSILNDEGTCVVMEHLRDTSNFLAYNIGFFHFFSATEWRYNFSKAGFKIDRIIKITSFVSVFILKKL